MEAKSPELDARAPIVLSKTLHSSLIAASIATLISLVAFGIVGTEMSEIWSHTLPIVAIAFCGTYVGCAIAFGISAAQLRKAAGPRPAGAAGE